MSSWSYLLSWAKNVLYLNDKKIVCFYACVGLLVILALFILSFPPLHELEMNVSGPTTLTNGYLTSLYDREAVVTEDNMYVAWTNATTENTGDIYLLIRTISGSQ